MPPKKSTEEKKKRPAPTKEEKEEKKRAKEKEERAKAEHQETVEYVWRMLKYALARTDGEKVPIGYARVIKECLRWMAPRYSIPFDTMNDWMKIPQFATACGRTDPTSDGVNLGAYFFFMAMEEIMLTSRSRTRVSAHAKVLAGYRTQSHTEEQHRHWRKIHKQALGKDTEGIAKIEANVQRFERLDKIEVKNLRQLKSAIDFPEEYIPEYSPELLLLIPGLDEDIRAEIQGLSDAQRHFLVTSRMDTLTEAFRRFEDERPFAALIRVINKTAKGAIDCIDVAYEPRTLKIAVGGNKFKEKRIVEENNKHLFRRVQEARAAASDVQKVQKDLDSARENKTKLKQDLEGLSTDEGIDAAKQAFEEAKDQYESTQRSLRKFKALADEANRTVHEAYHRVQKGLNGLEYGTGWRFFRLFFRGPIGIDEDGSMPIALTKEFAKRNFAKDAQLDTVVFREIQSLTRGEQIDGKTFGATFNDFINPEFISFFRTLSEARTAQGSVYFPTMATYVDYAKQFTDEAFGSNEQSRIPVLVDVVLARILHNRPVGTLLLTALWCKFIIWSRTTSVPGGVTKENVQAWLRAFPGAYPPGVDAHFAKFFEGEILDWGQATNLADNIIETAILFGDPRARYIPSEHAAKLVELGKALRNHPFMFGQGRTAAVGRAQLFTNVRFRKAKPEVKRDLYPAVPTKPYNLTVSSASAIAKVVKAEGTEDGWVYPDGTIRYTFARPISEENPGPKATPVMEFSVDLGLVNEDYVRDTLVPAASVVSVVPGVPPKPAEFPKGGNPAFLNEIQQLLAEAQELKLDATQQGQIQDITDDAAQDANLLYQTLFRFHPDRVYWDVYFPEEPGFRFSWETKPQVARAKLARYADTMQITCHFTTQNGDSFTVVNPEIQMRMQHMMWAQFQLDDDAKTKETDTQRMNKIKKTISDHTTSTLVPLSDDEADILDDIGELASRALGVSVKDMFYDWKYHNHEFVARAWLYRWSRKARGEKDQLFAMGWQRWENEYFKLGLGGDLARGRDEDMFLKQIERENLGTDSKKTLFDTEISREYVRPTNENEQILAVVELAARRFRQTAHASLTIDKNEEDTALTLTKAGKTLRGEYAFFLPPLPMQSRVGELLDRFNESGIVQAALEFQRTDQNFEQNRAQQLEQFNFRIRRLADRWRKIEREPDTKDKLSDTTIVYEGLNKTFADLTLLETKEEKKKKKKKRSGKDEKVDTTDPDLRLLERPSVILALSKVALILHYASRRLTGTITSWDTEANEPGFVHFSLTLRDFSRALVARMDKLGRKAKLYLDEDEEEACLFIAERCVFPMITRRNPADFKEGAFRAIASESKTLLEAYDAFNIFCWLVYRKEVEPNSRFLPDDEEDDRALQMEIYQQGKAGIGATLASREGKDLVAKQSKPKPEIKAEDIAQEFESFKQDAEADFEDILFLLKPILVTGGIIQGVNILPTLTRRWLRNRRGVDIPANSKKVKEQLDQVLEAVSTLMQKANDADVDLLWIDEETGAFEFRADDLTIPKDQVRPGKILAKQGDLKLPVMARAYFEIRLPTLAKPEPLSTIADTWHVLVTSVVTQYAASKITDIDSDKRKIIEETSAKLFYLLAYYTRVFNYLRDVSMEPLPPNYPSQVEKRAEAIAKTYREIRERKEEEEAQALEDELEEESDSDDEGGKSKQVKEKRKKRLEKKKIDLDYRRGDENERSDFTFGELEEDDLHNLSDRTEEDRASIFIKRINDLRDVDSEKVFGVLLGILHISKKAGVIAGSPGVYNNAQREAAQNMIQMKLLDAIKARVITGWTATTRSSLIQRAPGRVAALDELRVNVLEHTGALMKAAAEWRPKSADESVPPLEDAKLQQQQQQLKGERERQLIREMRGRFLQYADATDIDLDKPIRELEGKLKRFTERLRQPDELFALVSLQYYLSLLDEALLIFFPVEDEPDVLAMEICRYGGGVKNTLAQDIKYLTAIRDRNEVFIPEKNGDVVIFPGLTAGMRRVLENTIAEKKELNKAQVAKAKKEKEKEEKSQKRKRSPEKEAPPEQKEKKQEPAKRPRKDTEAEGLRAVKLAELAARQQKLEAEKVKKEEEEKATTRKRKQEEEEEKQKPAVKPTTAKSETVKDISDMFTARAAKKTKPTANLGKSFTFR